MPDSRRSRSRRRRTAAIIWRYMATFMLMAVATEGAGMSPTPVQGSPSPAISASTRLVFLGTAGGPSARIHRSQPAALVQVGERIYLVDAGAGLVQQLAKAEIKPNNIHHLFLTHLHADHISGLAAFIAYRWIRSPKPKLAIVGPVGTSAVVEGALRYMDIPTQLHGAQLPSSSPIASSVEVRETDGSGPTLIYKDDLVKVTAVENTHYRTIDPSRIPATRSYALRFDTPDRSIVFTGDTGPSAAVERLAAGADILVSEVIDLPAIDNYLRTEFGLSDDNIQPQLSHMSEEHLTPYAVGRLAQHAKPKMVILTHIVTGATELSDMRIMTDGIKKYYDGPIVTARDLDEF